MKLSKEVKAKVHCVTIDDVPTLVEAQTQAGAIRDVVNARAEEMRKRATCDLATGEQLYHAGKKGLLILNSGKYAKAVDPNQMGLTGIPETAEDEGNGTP